MFDDGRLKTASYDQSSGFGLRAVAGDAHGYAHSEIIQSALKRAVDSVSAVTKRILWTSCTRAAAGSNAPLYSDDNPLNHTPFEKNQAFTGN